MKVLVDLTWMSAERINLSFSKYALRLFGAIPAPERGNYRLLFEKDSAAYLQGLFPGFERQSVNLFRGGVFIPRPRNLFRAINFASAVRASGCDRLFFPGEAEPFMMRGLKLPCLLVIHDLKRLKVDFGDGDDTLRGRLRARRMKARYGVIIPAASRIAAVSAFTADDIRRFFPGKDPASIDVVYNAVTVSPESKMPAGVEEGEKYILYINSLERFKNLHTIVRAYARIAGEIPEKLLVVGKESRYYRDTVLPLIKRYGLEERILRLQDLKDAEIRCLYENASLFVSPSLHEGFGYTPIEAAICRCPVLCSRCDSLPEVSEEMLNYYEPAEDASALAAQMKALLLQAPVGGSLEKISAHFSEKYSPRRQAEEIGRILKTI